MFLLSDLFRDYLIVFLEASFIALGVLFAYVLVRHAVASWREQRDASLRALYQPDVDAVLAARAGRSRVGHRAAGVGAARGTCRRSARS